jgi:hypothetical protein
MAALGGIWRMTMGVDRTDYLMLAAEVGFDGFDFDKHQAEIEGAPGAKFDIVRDGMCGKYCLAGKIIARSEPYEGLEMAKVNVGAVLQTNELADTISESFGRKIAPSEFSLILFSHFH